MICDSQLELTIRRVAIERLPSSYGRWVPYGFAAPTPGLAHKLHEGPMSGYIQVTVQGSGFHHSTLIPVVNPQSLWHVNQIVNFARTLAAAA